MPGLGDLAVALASVCLLLVSVGMTRGPLTLGCLVLSTAVASATHAQTRLGSERGDIRHETGDVWAVWTAPVRGTTRDIPPAIGAASLIAATSMTDSAFWVWMNTHSQTLVMRLLRPIREEWKFPVYEFGSGQLLLPVSGALYTAGRLSRDADLRDAGLGCAAGHLASLGVRSLIYRSVSRARPRVTLEPDEISFPGSDDWSDHSFLSGHVANSMACASFLGHRFALGKGALIPYGVSLAIGLGRLADGRHWASDAMAGAVLGFAIGKAIAARQLERNGRGANTASAQTRGDLPVPLLRFSVAF